MEALEVMAEEAQEDPETLFLEGKMKVARPIPLFLYPQWQKEEQVGKAGTELRAASFFIIKCQSLFNPAK